MIFQLDRRKFGEFTNCFCCKDNSLCPIFSKSYEMISPRIRDLRQPGSTFHPLHPSDSKGGRVDE